MLMSLTDLGKAIRAVAKQREGARLVGIDVEHVFAVTFGIGIACLGAAGCMLLPIFYVDPYTRNVFCHNRFYNRCFGRDGRYRWGFARRFYYWNNRICWGAASGRKPGAN